MCNGILECLCARYNVSPVNLQIHCDGCVTAFVNTHALSCSIDCLVITRHNEIHDKLFYLSWRVFTSAYVRAEPLIRQGRTRSDIEIRQGSYKHKDMRGDLMIQSLWGRQVYAIIDVKLGDADAVTYNYYPMTSLLARWEKIKKDKHDKHCHNQRKHYSPFFFQWT